MRLEFKILWFENQPDAVKAQREDIIEYIESVGFVASVQMEEGAANLEALAAVHEKYDEYDLVVVDYDLGEPGKNGDWVAQQVRRRFGFTDIIFYSGKKPGDLRKMVCDASIDGVYCFNRPQLAEKLAVHIDQVVRRLSRLEAMRGLAMGVVGKCDDELRKILHAIYVASDEAGRTRLNLAFDEAVRQAAASSATKYAREGKFAGKLASRAASSFVLYKVSLNILRGYEGIAAEREKFAAYNDEVLDPRNILGHATEQQAQDGWVVTSTAAPPIGTADFPRLRQQLASHLANIRSIGAHFGVD
jgi:hypothetical protein